jgi:type IV secretory pathway VirB6-like protein
MCLYLTIGPLTFAFRVHERTSGYFTTWWQNMVKFAAAQLYMFSIVALFTALYLNVVESIMYFKICYRSLISIPFINISIFGWWQIANVPPPALRIFLNDVTTASATQFSYLSFNKIILLLIIVASFEKFFHSQLFGNADSLNDFFGGVTKALSALRSKARSTAVGMITAPITIVNEQGGEMLRNIPGGEIISPFTNQAAGAATGAVSGVPTDGKMARATVSAKEISAGAQSGDKKDEKEKDGDKKDEKEEDGDKK